MLFLLSTSAFALTCDASDTACNAANQIRDLVNSVQPGAMDDNFSGKRGTNFVRSKIETLEVIFTDAGFEWREPGCSMCLAMNADKLGEKEHCASTSNRNFEGRQGYGGRTHLVSPEMAAAAAIAGHFVDIRHWR